MIVSAPSLKDHRALYFTFLATRGGEFREGRGLVDLRPVPVMRRHRILIDCVCLGEARTSLQR